MPNAGLPELGKHGATYPLTPEQLADAHDHFTKDFGLALVGGCCGTTPEHMRQVVERVGGRELAKRKPRPEAGVASLYQHVAFRQDTSYLSIGERTNANGSRAFRDAMLAEKWDDCIEIARDQTRDGSHLLDVCIDYVGRDGVNDMREITRRFATASTLPLVLDSTEPAVIEAGLETLGGRSVINSVNYEDGDGPDVALRPGHADGPRARRRCHRAVHRRGGPGPDGRVEGPRRHPADRGPHHQLGHAASRTSSSTH